MRFKKAIRTTALITELVGSITATYNRENIYTSHDPHINNKCIKEMFKSLISQVHKNDETHISCHIELYSVTKTHLVCIFHIHNVYRLHTHIYLSKNGCVHMSIYKTIGGVDYDKVIEVTFKIPMPIMNNIVSRYVIPNPIDMNDFV